MIESSGSVAHTCSRVRSTGDSKGAGVVFVLISVVVMGTVEAGIMRWRGAAARNEPRPVVFLGVTAGQPCFSSHAEI